MLRKFFKNIKKKINVDISFAPDSVSFEELMFEAKQHSRCICELLDTLAVRPDLCDVISLRMEAQYIEQIAYKIIDIETF